MNTQAGWTTEPREIDEALGRTSGVTPEIKIFSITVFKREGACVVIVKAARSIVRPLVVLALAGLSLGTLSLALGTAPVRGQQVDRVAMILKSFDAFNRHDVNALLETYTDDALFVGGAPCQPATPCIGKAAFRKPFEAGTASHASIKVINTQTRGSVVIGRFELRADGIRAKGVERIINVFLAEVPKDLVTVWVAVPDLADPDTAKFLGAR